MRLTETGFARTLDALLRDAPARTEDAPAALAFFGGADCYEDLRTAIARIENNNRLAILKGAAEDDMFKFIPDSRSAASAQRFERLMQKWEAGARPSLPGIALRWLERLAPAIDDDHTSGMYRNALLLLAARAEMVGGKAPEDARTSPSEPAYHNRLHFLHVLQAAGHLIEQNDDMLLRGDPAATDFSDRDRIVLLLAALAHDLDHPGTGNGRDPFTGKSRLFVNEERSFALADTLFIACDLPQDDREAILLLLRATDPNGPHKFVKAAMEAHESGVTPTLSRLARGEENLYRPLAPVLYNAKLCAMAALLSDADLFASAGAGLEVNAQTSENLTRELRAAGVDCDLTTPQSRLGFFENFMGTRGFSSAAGRRAFNEACHEATAILRKLATSAAGVPAARPV